MKAILTPVLGVLFAASWVSLQAQTTVTPAEYTLDTAFYADELVFQAPNDTYRGFGINLRTVDGIGQVYEFCAEIFIGTIESPTYNYTNGFGSNLNATQTAAISRLVGTALPQFINLYDAFLLTEPSGEVTDPSNQAAFSNLQSYASGIQIALWEIIEDTPAPYTLAGGNIQISAGDQPDTEAIDAVTYAESFVSGVDDGSFTDPGYLTYYYADGGTEQDRLWVQVPEPSISLLGLLGAALLLRRRRV